MCSEQFLHRHLKIMNLHSYDFLQICTHSLSTIFLSHQPFRLRKHHVNLHLRVFTVFANCSIPKRSKKRQNCIQSLKVFILEHPWVLLFLYSPFRSGHTFHLTTWFPQRLRLLSFKTRDSSQWFLKNLPYFKLFPNFCRKHTQIDTFHHPYINRLGLWNPSYLKQGVRHWNRPTCPEAVYFWKGRPWRWGHCCKHLIRLSLPISFFFILSSFSYILTPLVFLFSS